MEVLRWDFPRVDAPDHSHQVFAQRRPCPALTQDPRLLGIYDLDNSFNNEVGPLPLVSSSTDSGALPPEAEVLCRVPECETPYMSVPSIRGIR